MLTGLVIFAFAGGFATAAYAIGTTVAPKVDQILFALRGAPARQFTPLATLALAENRIAVRRWAVQPMSSTSRMMRSRAIA